jgi:hypothetical protein
MADTVAQFTCSACQRTYSWKKELAGKRVKCKCGQPVTVPAAPPEPPPEPEDDGLYDLADAAADAQKAVSKLPPKIVEAPVAATSAAPARTSRGGVPLEYRRARTAHELERDPARTIFDVKRDLYVPVVLIVVGAFLYIGYYAIEYHLGTSAFVSTGMGLAIMTLLETVILVGFALFIANPLGVSFGPVGSAILKLAAIAILCDGITTWVDGMVGKYTGGFGNSIFGFGMIGFPIALAVYWGALIYLFSMDHGDSWTVVAILSVFYRIVRIVLLFLLLNFFLHFGGIAVTLPSAGGGSVAPVSADPVSDEVDRATALNLMKEARQYVIDFSRRAEASMVSGLYDAGSKNVWFMLDRDLTGKTHPLCIVDELPNDKTHRAKCFDIAKSYFDENKLYYDPATFQDTGQRYLMINLPE